MKKIFQNTLVCDFIGTVFCLAMTCALILVFTGCYEEDRSLAGGTAEETSIVTANNDIPGDTSTPTDSISDSIPDPTPNDPVLDLPGKAPLYGNIKLAGHAKCVALLPNPVPAAMLSEEADTVFHPVTNEWSGHTVRLSELDSVTLEPTGVNYISQATDSVGAFDFDSISLNSHYALLELSPLHDDDFWERDTTQEFYDYVWDRSRHILTYKTIVDLRSPDNIEINAFTYLRTVRIQNLVKQGIDFAAATQQAEREVLEIMGVYDETTIDMQNPKISIAEEHLGYLLENWTRYYSAKYFTDVFATTGTIHDDRSVDHSISRWLFNWYEYYILEHTGMTNEAEIAFMNNFLAAYKDIGQCSAANEGDTTRFYDLNLRCLTVTCESGAWNVTPGYYTMAEKIPFTTGTMTDERDGKTYKTVTYNIQGQSQTWFAENLTFSDDSIQPVIGLDSVIYRTNQGRDTEFREYMDSLDSTYWNTLARYKKSDVFGADTIPVVEGHLQGICPSGWHIPTKKEWSNLMYFAEVESGMSSQKEAEDILKYEGFGWYASRYLHEVGFGDFTLEAYAIIDRTEPSTHIYGLIMDNWKPQGWSGTERLSVRCVMD